MKFRRSNSYLAAIRATRSQLAFASMLGCIFLLVTSAASADAPKLPPGYHVDQPNETDATVDEDDDVPVDLDGVEVPVKHWHFGGGLFYSTARQLVFSSVNSNSTGYIYRYNMGGAPSASIEVKYGGPHTWGMQIGLQADGARTITDFEAVGNGSSQTGAYTSANQPKLTFIDLYLNAVYRWSHFYLPFGINLAGVGSIDPPVQLKDMVGSEGAQVGVGWELNDHFAVEALERVLLVSGKKQSDPTSGTTEVGMGYLLGTQLGIKAYF